MMNIAQGLSSIIGKSNSGTLIPNRFLFLIEIQRRKAIFQNLTKEID